MLSVRRVTRRFGDRIAVDDVSFDVARGEIVALVGPNGAGKTTTLRMLAGLVQPTRGSIAIDGIALTPRSADALRGRIGFLTEAPGLWDRLTVAENLRIYAGLYSLPHPDDGVDRVLALMGVGDRRSTRAAELSKGLRQRVALARALLHDPPVLLLDEPMSGLDPASVRSVRALLAERRDSGGTILISTHNLAEAERLADRIAVLRRRLVALDDPSALRRRQAGRLLIRLAGAAAAYLEAAAAFDAHARADGPWLTLDLADPEHRTPALVQVLVDRGARIVEVRPEVADLEEVYLQLIAEDQ